jgi:hypothetical protein
VAGHDNYPELSQEPMDFPLGLHNFQLYDRNLVVLAAPSEPQVPLTNAYLVAAVTGPFRPIQVQPQTNRPLSRSYLTTRQNW